MEMLVAKTTQRLPFNSSALPCDAGRNTNTTENMGFVTVYQYYGTSVRFEWNTPPPSIDKARSSDHDDDYTASELDIREP